MTMSHRRTVLLVASLAANAALLAAFALRPAATREYFRDVFTRGAASSRPAPARPDPAAIGGPTAVSPGPEGETGLVWSDLPAGDFVTLVARLRAAGFPSSMVRAIVLAAVNEHYAARRLELMPNRYRAREYWRNPRSDPANDSKYQLAMRELAREQQKLVRDLLGGDLRRADDEEGLRRQFGELSPAKVDQFQKINTDYQDLINKVHEETLGITLPEDRAKLALLEKEKRADIERLLTPDELLDYDLRNSQAASQVRGRLGRFDITEEEFRALYFAQKDLLAQNPIRDRPEPGVRQQRVDAFESQLLSVIGPDRFVEFKKINGPQPLGPDPETIGRLVQRLNLPEATTQTVHTVQTEIQQRAAVVRANPALTPEQRTAQLATLGNEASARLGQALGTVGLDVYRQNGGQWLQGLTRPPPPGRGAPPNN